MVENLGETIVVVWQVGNPHVNTGDVASMWWLEPLDRITRWGKVNGDSVW
jgi:hypothetical protein